MSILLKDARFFAWDTLEETRGDIRVEANALEHGSELAPRPGDEVIDCSGKIVTRSFACAHHHIYSALARGMPGPSEPPQNFSQILERVWWRLDKALDLESIRASALATAAACIRSGTTFVIDHHSSPYSIRGSLDTIASALDKAGVGHLLCYELSNRDGRERAEEGLEETADYLSRRQGLVGLHASFTVDDELLRAAAGLAAEHASGVHVHVAEGEIDEASCEEVHGKRVLERFEEAGLLESSKSILAHCLHLDDTEWRILERSQAWVVQNTESNLNNAVGGFLARGARGRVMIGTDGMHSDMIRAAQAAYFVGQRLESLPMDVAYRRLRAAHRYLETNGYTGDGEQNLVVLDYDPPTEIQPGNFLGHLLFGIGSRNIRHVIAEGRFLLRDGKLTTIDEAEVMGETREIAGRLWSRIKSL